MSIADAFGGANAPLAADLTISGSLQGLKLKTTIVHGGTYDMKEDDCFLTCWTSDGPITINLLNTSIPGKTVTIVDQTGTAAVNNITIVAPGELGAMHGWGVPGHTVVLNHNYANICMITTYPTVYNVTSYYNA
jgi:hypothetical protein